ncbi:PBS lyase HEAT-like repeat protein [Calothrix parasitica NIES-267]|uniref:PBS lyase HEAT-like repeat protein n=1 Tax=Calothrix parasitica NIES-267 TaxID=1973488 RepID=A0A1Z4M0Z9_9CYAN|nr:PBS lyase HEAT-like repeat protein [Calothrix parasitica NIES-267]
MSELTNALNRILNWFENNKPSTIESLQPGLAIEEIKEKVQDLPFRLTQEVYELYQWRNGMVDDGSCFFQAFRFFSLEEAIEESQIMGEAWGLSLPFGWFPIFEFEGEYFSAVGAEENTKNSLITRTYHDIGISYRNLTNMMLYIAECYETGAYYIGDSRFIEENEVAVIDILQKYEPESSSIFKFRDETIENLDGSKVVNSYHPDSNILLNSRILGRKGETIESARYFQGKIFNRMTWNYNIEGFHQCICTENWFNDYEKWEEFFVEYQPKCLTVKMERRYINGVLKEEIIHPDRQRDNFF